MKLEYTNLNGMNPEEQFKFIDDLARTIYMKIGSTVPDDEILHGVFRDKTKELFKEIIENISYQNQNLFYVRFLTHARIERDDVQSLRNRTFDETYGKELQLYDEIKEQMAYQKNPCDLLEIKGDNIPRLFNLSTYAKTGETVFYDKKESKPFEKYEWK